MQFDFQVDEMRGDTESQSGFILISSLLSAALLAFLLAYILSTTRYQIRLSGSYTNAMQTQLMSEAAVLLRAVQISSEPKNTDGAEPTAEDSENGKETVCRLDGFDGSVRLSVRDHGGLVDLNFAAEPLILAGLIASGVTFDTAKSVASKIVEDRRSQFQSMTDLEKPLVGGIFAKTDQLSQYFPFNPLQAQRFSEYFTVYTRKNGLDPIVAPERLITALPQALSALGNSSDIGAVLPNGVRFPTFLYRPTAGDIYTVQAKAYGQGNSKSHSVWVIRKKASAAYPFTRLEHNSVLVLKPDGSDVSETLPLC